MPRASSSSSELETPLHVEEAAVAVSSRWLQCGRNAIVSLALVAVAVPAALVAVGHSRTEGTRLPFVFEDPNGSPVPRVCADAADDATCAYNVSGGSCRHAEWLDSSLNEFTLMYYVLSFSVLLCGTMVMLRTGDDAQLSSQNAAEREDIEDGKPAEPAAASAASTADTQAADREAAARQLSELQRSSLLGELPAESERRSACRRMIDDPSNSFKFLGIAILVQTIGSIQMGNLQKQTLSLAESNAVDDVNSITSVIADIFMFFEDGMTVLIGVAVGSGDARGAGTLVGLGYLGSVTSGLLGSAVATGVAFAPGVMEHIAPAPVTAGGAVGCNSSMLDGGGGLAAATAEATLIEMALPYWLISVWTWSFSFANGVATGAALGADAGFWYALGATLAMAAAFGAFFAAMDLGSNTIAVAVSQLAAQATFAVVMAWALFCDSTVTAKLEPQGFSALFSKRARGWARLAASSGFAMMLQMLCGQVRATMTVQLAARLGQGYQYRYSVLTQIQGNMWVPMIFGYTIRITGSKFWGAAAGGGEGAAHWRTAFFWLCSLLLKGVFLLAAVSIALAMLFRDSLPYAFASNHICELLESTCTAPIYRELYEHGFEASYVIWAANMLPSAAAPFLSSALYATMDFSYVRNVSFVTVALYVPLALCSYFLLPPAEAVLGLQLAYSMPDVILSFACLWRLRRLSRKEPAGAQEEPERPQEKLLARASRSG
jgi:hypothetical protein